MVRFLQFCIHRTDAAGIERVCYLCERRASTYQVYMYWHVRSMVPVSVCALALAS